jgi:hypothetical protein
MVFGEKCQNRHLKKNLRKITRSLKRKYDDDVESKNEREYYGGQKILNDLLFL